MSKVRLVSCVLAAITGLAALAFTQAESGSSVTLTRLETNAALRSLGTDDPAPRLGWALVGDQRGVMQASYRALVASRPELLQEGRPTRRSSRARRSSPWRSAWCPTSNARRSRPGSPKTSSAIVTAMPGWACSGLATSCRCSPRPATTTSPSRWRPRPTSRAGATGRTWRSSRRWASTGPPTPDRATTTSSGRSRSGSPVGAEGGRIVYEIGSGRYEFRVGGS